MHPRFAMVECLSFGKDGNLGRRVPIEMAKIVEPGGTVEALAPQATT